MTFIDCLRMCAKNAEFVAEFDRLHGTQLSKLDKRTPLDALIDDSTGRDRESVKLFADFVWRFVWLTFLQYEEGRKDD